MGITTKTGDRGFTSLLYGGRVRKDNLRIEACGILDELSSFLGLAKSLIKDKWLKKVIDKIQTDLLIIGSELVTKVSSLKKLKRRTKKEDVEFLESFIEKLEKSRNSKANTFVLSGENAISAVLDVTRTFARRAERTSVKLRNKKMLRNQQIIVYLNRLSDLLYLFARSYEKKSRIAKY